jgi:hypothetical protein
MARPKKEGVDYFSLDVDFFEDDKIRLLRAEFGAKGMYILVYLLCEIYAKNGYYMSWNESKCLLVSDGAGCGCNPGFVQEFINGCFKRSFFDKGVFDMFGILTSKGIQRRYLYAVMTRKQIRLIKEYCLLNSEDFDELSDGINAKIIFKSINLKETPVNLKETNVNFKEMPQSKVKESKVKESMCVLELPCKNGSFAVDKAYLDTLTHTHPNMDVEKSLQHLRTYLQANPEKQRYTSAVRGYIEQWVQGDDESGKYRKSAKSYPATYDISLYESTSVIYDEE